MASSNRILGLCRGAIEAFRTGGLREAMWRARLRWKRIDLEGASLADLGLSPGRSIRHGSAAGPALEAILSQLGITSGDAVLDMGSGKGGALLTLAQFPFRKLAGVELSPELIRIAEQNCRRMGVAGVHFHCCDAGRFEDLDGFTHIFLYHPFPAPVMSEVLQNIRSSLVRRPRDLTIIYVNPVCHSVIEASGLFGEPKHYPHPKHDAMIYHHRASDAVRHVMNRSRATAAINAGLAIDTPPAERS